MDVVDKITPINDENNRKKSGYFISANLSLFYYKYIFRNSSRMNIMDSDIFYDRYIAEDFEIKYVPKVFEDVCRQYLIRKNRMGCMDEIFEKMQDHGVLIRQPQANALRINCGTAEENAACLTALEAVVKELEA